jgi:hypothetical protein
MKKNENDLENLNEMINLSEEHEKAKPYLEKFNKAKTFNSSRQEAYAENMAFYQGNQHLLKKYKNETPWVVNMNTPYATIAIDNRVSSLLANDYIGELLPMSEDDVDAVQALSKVFQKEWKRMNLDEIVRACVRGGSVVREFYCHIVVNKNKTVGGKNSKNLGRIEAYAIEPSRIYIDPSARCLRDARYMFVTGRISKEEASEKYSKIKNALQVSNTFTPQDRGEVYYDNDYVTSQDDVFTTLTYYGKENGKIKSVKLINGIIVEETTRPNKNFPILQFRWKKAAQSCYGLSLMDEVLSLQKAITSIESAITNTAMSYAAPSMMVRKGCGVDPRVVAKANGAPGVVYSVEGDLDNALKPVIPPKIQQEILNIKTDFQAQIDKITGNSNQFLGDIGTAGNTSSGATIAVERAKIIEIDVLNNIKEFVEDITEVLVEYISLIYNNETMTYNAGKNPDGTFKFEKIDLPDKGVLLNSNYQYYIELETKTPYNKEKQKQLLLEIYQLERQYDTAIKTVTVGDIIKNTDLENKDEIISRFGNLTYQDAMTKTETIRGLIQTATSYGINEELINSAIAEIIAGQNETPAVDELMAVMEDAFKVEMQKNDETISNVTDLLMSSPSQQAQIESMANEVAPSPEMLGLNEEQPQE